MERALIIVLGAAALRTLCLALPAGIAAGRIRNISVRHALWLTVLVSMILMPFLTIGLQPLPLPLAVRHSAPVAKVLDRVPGIELPSLMLPHGASIAPADTGVVTNSRTSGNPSPSWYRLLVLLYFAGLLVCLTRLIVAYSGTRRLVNKSRAISPVHFRELMERDFAGRPAPRVMECSEVRVPMVVGAWDPVVLLPVQWKEWDSWTLRAVLVHELTHIRRRDWIVNFVAAINTCLYWFHPLAWFLERRLASLAEAVSDEASVRLTGDAPRYAEVLLKMASETRSGGRLAIQSIAMARGSNVARRIDRVLEMKEFASVVVGRARWVALLTCITPFVLTAAAVQVAGPPPIVSNLQEPDAMEILRSNPLHTPAEAEEAELHLNSNPQDLERRLRLMAYYYLKAMKEPWLKHVFWLIEHRPETKASQSRLTSLSAGPKPFFNGSEDYERAKTLWIWQVQAHPQDPRVLRNAGDFIARSDLALGEKLLWRARSLEPADEDIVEKLVWLYAGTLNWVYPPDFPNVPPGPDPAFVAHVKNFLETTTEAQFPGRVALLMATVHNRMTDPRVMAAEERRIEYFRTLFARARALEPDNNRWHHLIGDGPRREGPPTTIPGSTTQLADAPPILKNVPMVLPPMLDAGRISGFVTVIVKIGTDGKVIDARVRMGHPLAAAAALEAVRQWIFETPRVNGVPAEIEAQVRVPFGKVQ